MQRPKNQGAGPYPNRIGYCIKKYGYSYTEVADEIGIARRTLYNYISGERAAPRYCLEKIAHLLACEVGELMSASSHSLTTKYDILEAGYESDFSALGKEMIIKRRELLRLLSVAGGALFVSGIDWEHIEAVLVRPSHIDMAVVNDLETINNRCWNLYMAASPKASVLDGVLGQLKMQIQFVNEARTPQVHQRLCALASSMSQLAGEIFFDLHDHDTAQSCYVFAATSAKEAKSHDLWASALVRHSYLPIFDERFEDALPLLKQAEYIAQRGDSALPTKYWAAVTSAEAESGLGNLKACQSAFERAYGVHNLAAESPAWSRFDGSRLPALQGACYVRLERPDQAEPLLQQALQQTAKAGRRRAMILSDLALSALQQADVEKACTYADEVVSLASSKSSGFLRNNVLKIEQRLTPFANVGAVKALKNHIASLA
jgi:tetratricopeptide (TPR) repeat protein/transcriptional regulator with XRE-family HTH domain